ncbi:MAG: AbrB/MazE/SpoVT family DNA-binding domain-containing protein [Candidatus Methanosuratincola sp.]|nr:AbrB/MazE/SpoVT family DNA-binding domain-containing protein [Candidatus Methanosuratincola sp.]
MDIRRKLGLKEGDKVVFAEKGDDVILLNSNRIAFAELQAELVDEAGKAGISSEQDVVDLVRKVRRQLWEERHEGDA